MDHRVQRWVRLAYPCSEATGTLSGPRCVLPPQDDPGGSALARVSRGTLASARQRPKPLCPAGASGDRFASRRSRWQRQQERERRFCWPMCDAFVLVAAVNPRHCESYGDPRRAYSCAPTVIGRYQEPVADHVGDVDRLPSGLITESGEAMASRMLRPLARVVPRASRSATGRRPWRRLPQRPARWRRHCGVDQRRFVRNRGHAVQRQRSRVIPAQAMPGRFWPWFAGHEILHPVHVQDDTNASMVYSGSPSRRIASILPVEHPGTGERGRVAGPQ